MSKQFITQYEGNDPLIARHFSSLSAALKNVPTTDAATARAAYEAAMEADCEASEAAIDAEGTPQEEAAEAAADATWEALCEAQNVLMCTEIHEMVSAIKAKLAAASVRFAVEMHLVTTPSVVFYPIFTPAATFRFEGNCVALIHSPLNDTEEGILNGLEAEVRCNDKVVCFLLPEELDDFVGYIRDHNGGE